jgi:hypothetical protein
MAIELQEEKDPFRFCVYAYLRNKDSKTAKAGTPYYIGKGCGRRPWTKGKNESIHPPKNKSYIALLEQNLSNIGALAIERKLIRIWGRKDLRTGILCNRTDGGDGATGSNPSKETRAKYSASQKRRAPATDITRAKIGAKHKGKTISDKQKKYLSEIQTGVPDSTETKIKKSISHCGLVESNKTKQKKSDAAKDKPKSEQHCLSISLSKLNPVYWVSPLGEKFVTATKAREKYPVASVSAIRNWCKNKKNGWSTKKRKDE